MLSVASMYAQPTNIVDFTPSYATTGVDLTTDITITFDTPLPDEELIQYALDEMIVPFPLEAITINDITISSDRKTLTYNVTHEADTDYYWVVVDFPDWEEDYYLEKIFASYYTTAATGSGLSISGELSYEVMPFMFFKEQAAKKSVSSKLWDISKYYSAESSTKKSVSNPSILETSDDSKYYEQTLILITEDLLDLDELEGPPMGVVGAAIGKPDGTYTVDGIRNGTYYAFAIAFGNSENDFFGFGAYSVDDEEPLTFDIDDASRSDIDITLMVFDSDFSGSTLLEVYSDLYSDLSAEFSDIILFYAGGFEAITEMDYDYDEYYKRFAGQQIKENGNDELAPKGKSPFWILGFHSEDADTVIVAFAFPFGAEIFGIDTEEVADILSGRGLTTGFPDTDVIASIAYANGGAAFIDEFKDDEIEVYYELLAMYEHIFPDLPNPPNGIWMVEFDAYVYDSEESSYHTLVVFVNADTGEFMPSPTNLDKSDTGIPGKVALFQNYPNPFNPATQIHFVIPESSEVTLTIYDLTGRKVAELINGMLPAGAHTASFNAVNLSSGTYIYQLKSNNIVQTKRMTLIK